MLSPIALSSQSYLAKAQEAFKKGQYKTAITNYNLYPGIEKNKEALQQRGMAYFKLNDLPNTIKDLTASKNLGNKAPELYYRMAQVRQHLFDYEEASFFYKEYIKNAGQDGKYSASSYREIKNCLFAATASNQASLSLVQSFGDEINSRYDEIAPTRSPKYGNVYYLSSNVDQNRFDIHSFFIDDKGQWERNPDSVDEFSTTKNEIIQDISLTENDLLYLSQNTPEVKTYFFSSFYKDSKIEIPLQLLDAVDLQLVDSITIAFASAIEGGYGGYDLYTIKYMNGAWSNPKNMGPQINSPYDERSPFLTPNEQRIYFSSNKPYCYGGYDVYVYSYDDGVLRHLDHAINSPGNDLGFKLDHKGQQAIFYSDRKTGLGGYDIYFAHLSSEEVLPTPDSTEFVFIKDYKAELELKKAKALAEEIERKKREASLLKEDKLERVPLIIDTQPKEIVEAPSEEDMVLFYQDVQDLRSTTSIDQMTRIVYHLKRNPDDQLRIIAFTDHLELGLPEFVQYNTLKKSLRVKDFFIKEGIKADRIQIESYANNYPLAKHVIAGEESEEFIKFNKRIDFEVVDTKGNIQLGPEHLFLDIPNYAVDRRQELFRSIRDELYFSVEISNVDRMFKNAVLRLYTDIYIRNEAGQSKNRYYIGVYTKYKDALQLKEELERSSAPYAKLIAFYNGKPVDASMLQELHEEYPELKNYITVD